MSDKDKKEVHDNDEEGDQQEPNKKNNEDEETVVDVKEEGNTSKSEVEDNNENEDSKPAIVLDAAAGDGVEHETNSPTSPLGGDTTSFLDADMLLSKGLSSFGRAGPDYLELSQTSLASLSLGDIFTDKETQNMIDMEWGNRNKLAEGMFSTLDIICNQHNPDISDDDPVGNEEYLARCEITAQEATDRLDYYILVFDDKSTLFCKAATAKELEAYLKAITEMKSESEQQKASLESERLALEAATAEFNTARIAAENTIRNAEEEIKRNAEQSRIQVTAQQKELEKAARTIADEQAKVESERAFRVEVLRHEDECRRMEETAWKTLWEERRKNEAERQQLEQEVESYRLEHATLSREAAFGRRKLLIEEEDRKSRVMQSEINRLEEEIQLMNTRKSNCGIDGIGTTHLRPTILEVAMRDNPGGGNKKINQIKSLADKLVDVQTEGTSLAIQLFEESDFGTPQRQSGRTASPLSQRRLKSTSPTSMFLRSLRKKYDPPLASYKTPSHSPSPSPSPSHSPTSRYSSPKSGRRSNRRPATPLQDPPSPYLDSTQYHMNLMMMNEIRSLRSEVSQLCEDRSPY